MSAVSCVVVAMSALLVMSANGQQASETNTSTPVDPGNENVEASATVDSSGKIENAVSPDKRWALQMKAAEFRCKVFLKDASKDKTVATIEIADFAADDVRDKITANWRKDSSAVALNISKGRNIDDCEILVFSSGRWRRVVWPEKELKAIRKRNNEEGGKAQDYLTFDSWLPDGIRINYQGNIGAVETIDSRIIPGAKPHLKIIKTYYD